MSTVEIEIPWDLPESQHEFYRELIAKGTSPMLANVLASRTPPRALTDREYIAGKNNVLSRVNAAAARSIGINPESHYYEPQLARWPGGTDPEGWVSGRGDIQKRHEERGWGCSGAVNVKAVEHEVPEQKEYKVAPHIVDGYVAEALAQHPQLGETPRKKAELRESLAEKLAGNQVSTGPNIIEQAMGE